MGTNEFWRGYDDAALDKVFRANESAEWKRGWHQFHTDVTKSETVRWV